jgi:hypothetical protein
MAVTCKVRETDQVFQALMEWGPESLISRDVHELIGGKSYFGNLYDGDLVRESGESFKLVPTKIEWKVFKTEDLEPLAAPYRLRIFTHLLNRG